MFDLKNFIEHGLLADLIKAEEAITTVNIIGDNSKEINKLENEITYTFAYLQRICVHEYVMAIARIFDRKSKNNKSRCLELLIDKMINHPELFPQVIEKYQTKNHVSNFGLNDTLVESLNRGDDITFTRRLGLSLFTQFRHLEIDRKIIKEWRDKVLAHNDVKNKVDKIFFKETNKLLDFGWEVVTIVGWAYLSTIYGFEGKNFLRDDTKANCLQIKTTINRLITPHNYELSIDQK